jgi:hypothetical protein
LTLSQKVAKNAFWALSKGPSQKRPEFRSKINLKAIADISFDIRNEFNENQMKLQDLGNFYSLYEKSSWNFG